MLFIHIGRGKAGSTTLQSMTRDNRDWFRARGTICPDIGHPTNNFVQLRDELNNSGKESPRAAWLAGLAREHAGENVFVSSEFFLPMRYRCVERLRTMLDGIDVRIVCYIRPYPDWSVSLYTQRLKKGDTTATFEQFFRQSLAQLSVVSQLASWAKLFGWSAVRVRSTDKASLEGGDLVADLCSALGIADVPPAVKDQNLSPAWPELEFMRAFRARHEALGHGRPAPSTIRRLSMLVRDCVGATGGAPRTSYLRPAHWRAAADLYNHDADLLSRLFGHAIPPLREAPETPPFTPDLAALSRPLRQELVRRIAGFAARGGITPQELEAAATIDSLRL